MTPFRNRLFVTNPYREFPYQNWEERQFTEWGSTLPVFRTILERIRPHLIIEVGTWLGGSAIHMASLMKEFTIPGEIVCVDTWLGSPDLILNPDSIGNYGMLDIQYGYPRIYFQFLANVCYAGYQNTITPFPQTSTNAAVWFKTLNVQADLIYLDGAHGYEAVKLDIDHYWPLVRESGVLLGDDWGMEEVARAARERFDDQLGNQDNKWFVQKVNGMPEPFRLEEIRETEVVSHHGNIQSSASSTAQPYSVLPINL